MLCDVYAHRTAGISDASETGSPAAACGFQDPRFLNQSFLDKLLKILCHGRQAETCSSCYLLLGHLILTKQYPIDKISVELPHLYTICHIFLPFFSPSSFYKHSLNLNHYTMCPIPGAKQKPSLLESDPASNAIKEL